MSRCPHPLAALAACAVLTPTLEIGYQDHGDAAGFPIVLLHGFPDDVRAWDAVAPPLTLVAWIVSSISARHRDRPGLFWATSW